MSFLRFTLSPLLLGVLLLCSCAGDAAKSRAAKQSNSGTALKAGSYNGTSAWQTRLGRVALVNRSLEFVLIDTGTSPVPEPGTRLRAYEGEEPSAELSVSAHQQRPFLIADILSGNPRVNDMVVPVKKNAFSDEQGGSPGGESGANRVPARLEQRAGRQPSPLPGPSPTHTPVKDPVESRDLPQIDRRPPPPPHSLLSPTPFSTQEADGIIPGVPVPGKATSR